MNEPKIKLRDGWTWRLHPHVERWAAVSPEGDAALVDRLGDVITIGCVPADVVLAVMAANAPDVLREHIAGLATPRDRTKPPPGWAVTPMGNVIKTLAGKLDIPGAWAVYDSEHAGCYPELVARIGELEHEVAALCDERDEARGAVARFREALGEDLAHEILNGGWLCAEPGCSRLAVWDSVCEAHLEQKYNRDAMVAGLTTPQAGSPSHADLWDAINRYAEATGGRTAGHISSSRMDAVAAVERCAAAFALDCHPKMSARITELEHEVEELRYAAQDRPPTWIDGRASVNGWAMHHQTTFRGDSVVMTRNDAGPIRIETDSHEDVQKAAVAVARALGGDT